MDINNNEITIKYFLDNGKLYRLVYKIDDTVAGLIPSAEKQKLEKTIQTTASKALETNPTLLNTLAWDGKKVQGDIVELDNTLTLAVQQASKKVAKEFFNPPPDLSATPVSSALPALTITSNISTFDDFTASIAEKHLESADKTEINAEVDQVQKFALLKTKLQGKSDPTLFNKIASDLSCCVKNPAFLKDLNPANFSALLSLLACSSVPALTTPQETLIKLHPYLANNQEFQDNLNLLIAVIGDVFRDQIQQAKDKKNQFCIRNSDALPEEPDVVTPDTLSICYDQVFSCFSHATDFAVTEKFKNFYSKLSSFFKPDNDFSETNSFSHSAQNIILPELPASRWDTMPDPVKHYACPPDICTQGATESAPDFERRLDTTIASLKDLISRDLDRLSFTIKTEDSDGNISTKELCPNLDLSKRKRTDDLMLQFKPVFDKIATYDKPLQVKILSCLNQVFITGQIAGTEVSIPGSPNLPFIPMGNVSVPSFTILLNTDNNRIDIIAEHKVLVNSDGSAPLAIKDLLNTKALVYFDNSGGRNREGYFLKRYKHNLLSLHSDLFDQDHVRIALD